MIYKRKLKEVLIKEVQKSKIVVITGMRQVGKTTLLLDIYNSINSENKVFIDLENLLNQKIFEEKNFENILFNLKEIGLRSSKNAFVFIDEIQLMPEIVKPIKYLYDHYKIKFFLSGSSRFYLKGLFPESLAGRKIIYELFPLDFEEFLIFKGKEKKFVLDFDGKVKNKSKINYEIFKNYYDEYLKFGGFPAVVKEDDVERKKMILNDIFKSYFEKDVRSLSNFKNINKFRDTILLLAARCGSKIEISKISSKIGISRETLYSYITFLEKTYFISLVQPFSKSINGEVRGAKKVYFCDTGLLNYLAKVSEGNLFENAVFNSHKKIGKINYYERYKGGEIDFIIDGKIGIEVKIMPAKADLKRLIRVANKIMLKKFFLVSKNFCDFENVILAQDL